MSEEERIALYNWIENDNKYEFNPISNNRMHYYLNDLDTDKNTDHPLIKILYNRLIEKESLHFYGKKLFIPNFIAYIYKGGYIHKHKDVDISEIGFIHTRFNIFIQVPPNDNGTYYANLKVETKERCYVVSRSSNDVHYTEPNTSNIARISISFGFLLPKEKVDDICKDMPYIKPLSHIKLFNRGNIITEDEKLQIKNYILSNNINNEFIESIKTRIYTKENLNIQSPTLITSYIIPYGKYIEKTKALEKDTIRFDIWIQLPKNGSYAYYTGLPVKTVECSYSLCRSGVDEFWTSPNEDSRFLIILSFSTRVSLEKIDILTSNLTRDMYMNYPLAI